MNGRQSKIIDRLEQDRELSVFNLVSEFAVSEATIRRDLAYLEEENRLIRTFGGARLLEDFTVSAKSFQDRKQKHRAEKKKIVHEAIKLIKPGMTISLDNGTTTWMISTLLKKISPLTVITSSLAIIQTLHNIPSIELILIGGKFRLRNLDFIGHSTVNGFHKWHTALAFISGDSLHPDKGVYKIEEESAAIIEAMAASTDKSVVLVDSSKIGKTMGKCLGVRVEDLDLLITNGPISFDVSMHPNLSTKVIQV